MSGRSRHELARNMGSGRPYQSPGARKEKLRERTYRHAGGGPGGAPVPYAELRAASAFSFLDGASLPEDLIARAAELDLPVVALVDKNGVYGAPRFWKAAKQAGLKALVGAEISLLEENWGQAPFSPERLLPRNSGNASEASSEKGACPHFFFSRADAVERNALRPRLTLLAESRAGYRNLSKLATAAALGRAKSDPAATWEAVARHAAGLHVLTGGDEGPLARALDRDDLATARALAERLAEIFPGRVHVEIQRHGLRAEERRNRRLAELAERLRLPLVATQGARYARREEKPLHDVLTSIRCHRPLDDAGSLLVAHRERHLKSAAEMAHLFADRPHALAHAHELAERLQFTLDDLGYRFPDYPLPAGETPSSYLRKIAWNGARARFRPLTARAQAQIAKELALIEKLDLAGYFLIVWDLVEFCRRERILCQGRGSAANSAVCYALGITAVDPVKMELLFERFLSEERGEWPDIDLDLPSGDQREKVIQYVYRRYGGVPADTSESSRPSAVGTAHPIAAAMTANVITYRDRSAAREVAKALGYSAEQVDKLAKALGSFRYDLERGDPRDLRQSLAAAGFDPEERRNRLFADYFRKIQNLPRHLGQHSGGMVIAAGRLDEVVPLEPAAMAGRVVVQWDKDDCADLGIIKVDLLGLGMLNALEEAIPIVRERERVHVDLAHLPPDDPGVYAMLRAADTVGVFQVESRAQMASLPRNAPERFYDLVIQVAIIRPGPITGGMVHPFFERRLGREPVAFFHPVLEPILARTLGVPIFQEQLLRMAMAVSGFTGGEAEELRRAMGFKRSVERMESIERRLRAGMAERGIVGETQDRIVQSITSFALYGFPESHAASFALIAYASAYLKRYHPTAFLISLLNAWPMGFYHPATLVKDAQRHGVTVLPIDVAISDWQCSWEDLPAESMPRSFERRESPEVGWVPWGRLGGTAGSLASVGRSRLRSDPRPSPRRDGQLPSACGSSSFLRDDPTAPTSRPSRQRTPAPTQRAFRAGPPAEGSPRGPSGLWKVSLSGAQPHDRKGKLSTHPVEAPARTICGPANPSRQHSDPETPRAAGACRLGLRYVSGLRRATAERLVAERARRPFADLDDLKRRAGLNERELAALAEVGALASFGMTRREALWQAALVARPAGELFEGVAPKRRRKSPLAEMSRYEETVADFRGTGMTVGPHPVAYSRAELERRGVIPAADLARLPRGARAKIAGAVIVRQRPGTAKGTLFLTVEDESGMAQAIVAPALLNAHRATIVGNPGLVIEGRVESKDGAVSLRAERFWPLADLAPTPSHDFR